MIRLLLLFILGGAAQAAPFLICDPSTQVPPVTHYSITITDTVSKAVKTVDSPLVNKGCKYDLAGFLPGNYEFKAKFFFNDPVFGRKESVFSAPLLLPIPDAPMSPAGLSVVPQ